MRLFETAQQLGYSPDTLRRLERQGVLEIPRDLRGHRRCTPEDVERLRAILYRRRLERDGAPSSDALPPSAA